MISSRRTSPTAKRTALLGTNFARCSARSRSRVIASIDSGEGEAEADERQPILLDDDDAQAVLKRRLFGERQVERARRQRRGRLSAEVFGLSGHRSDE